MSWLSQIIHQAGLDHLLPKDMNSVSDIESKLVKNAVPGVLHSLVGSSLAHVGAAVQTALHGAEAAAATEVAGVQISVKHAIMATIGPLNPELAAHVNDAVGSTITNVEHWAEGNIVKVAGAVVSALAAKFGLVL